MEKLEYEETRTRYAQLINRQLELEILIRKNSNDPVSLSALRQEYREVTSEVQNILINNILIATENGTN